MATNRAPRKRIRYLVVINGEHHGLYDTLAEANYRVDSELEWYAHEARKYGPGGSASIFILEVGKLLRTETISY